MDGLDTIISKAARQIKEIYINLPIENGDPVYRERVYCYELYHQMRRRWPARTPFVLNGEVSKAGHKKFPKNLRRSPDFLVHIPGQMAGNDTIIEVKSMRFIDQGSLEECDKDIETLSRFKSEAFYKRAIYLVYGECGEDNLKNIIRERYLHTGWNEEIELWFHPQAGCPARKVLVLSSLIDGEASPSL